MRGAIERIRGVGSPTELARLAWRKFVYRKIPMGITSIRAGDTKEPTTPTTCTFEVWGPERYDEILEANPNLAPVDIEHFRRQRTTLIVALDEGRLAASTWMTNGRTWVSELHRTMDIPPNEHLSCRTYVPEAYRGQALMAWMIYHHSVRQDPDDRIWGLVYERNAASIRSVENLGWRRTGDIWTHIVLGRSFGGSRTYPPRAPLPKVPVDRRTGERHPLPPALVLAGSMHAGPLHAARSIHCLGATVHVATKGDGAAVLGRSRAVASAVDLDLAHDPEAALLTWIERNAGTDGPVPVIPTNDQLLDLLHRVRHRLPAHVVAVAPPAEATEPLIDKATSLQLAEAAGLDVPPWRVVRSAADVDAVDDLALPIIVRPTAWSTTGDDRFKIAVVHDRERLAERLERSLAGGAHLIVQEYLEAPDDAVEFAMVWRSLDGTATEVCTGRKRRQASPDGGVMAWGETVELPDVRAAVLAFADAARFAGLGGIEVIRQGDRLRFIEFNPRLEAIHHLATAAGVDLVGIAYEEAALGQLPRLPSAQARAAAWSGTAWLERIRAERGAWRTMLADRRAFRRFEHRSTALWSPSDPAPGLASAARVVRAGLRRGAPRP